MYLEVKKNGNVFVFFNPTLVGWLEKSETLVVETAHDRHVFKGMDKDLWDKFYAELGPGVKLYLDLDEKRLMYVGV